MEKDPQPAPASSELWVTLTNKLAPRDRKPAHAKILACLRMGVLNAAPDPTMNELSILQAVRVAWEIVEEHRVSLSDANEDLVSLLTNRQIEPTTVRLFAEGRMGARESAMAMNEITSAHTTPIWNVNLLKALQIESRQRELESEAGLLEAHSLHR